MTNSVKPTPAQFRKFRAITGPSGLNLSSDQYAALLEGNGVETSKDLDAETLQTLIEALDAELKARRDPPIEVRRMRSRCIELLTTIGVYRGQNSWNAVNNYLRNPRVCGKALYEVSDITELKALVKKLSVLAKDAKQKRENLEFKARNN